MILFKRTWETTNRSEGLNDGGAGREEQCKADEDESLLLQMFETCGRFYLECKTSSPKLHEVYK